MLAELLIMLGLDATDKGINALTQTNSPNKWGVYRDGNGDFRIEPSLKKVTYGFTREGEYVLKYTDGKIALNIGLEIAKENEKEAKMQGKKFYLRADKGGSYTHKMGNDDIRGPRYCKVGSNYDTYYVKRYVVYVDPKDNTDYRAWFFMDMNYQFVDFDDDTDAQDLKYYGKIQEEYRNNIKSLFKKAIEGNEPIDWKRSLNRELSTFHCGKQHKW